MTKQELQQLRNEIVLNSLYTDDYTNSFNIPARQVQDFFDGWLDSCATAPLDDNGNTLDDLNLSDDEYCAKLYEMAEDIDALNEYYIYMFEEDPLSQEYFEKYYQ